ncbi:hypothetical protein HK096_010586, partial [Nowakowskiella sp. JEL0078]
SKADTEVFDENGKGPLHQACLNSHENVVSYLVDVGANMNAVNLAGNSPVHIAATRPNSKECVRWLLMRGADREKSNRTGQSPLQIATMSGNVEVAEMIKKFSSDQIIPPPPKPIEIQLLTLFREKTNEIRRSNSTSSFCSPGRPSEAPRNLQIAHNRRHSQNRDCDSLNLGELGNSLPSLHFSSSDGKNMPLLSTSPGRGGIKRTTQKLSPTKEVTKKISVPPPPKSPRPASLAATTSTFNKTESPDKESPAKEETLSKESPFPLREITSTENANKHVRLESNLKKNRAISTPRVNLEPYETKDKSNTTSPTEIAKITSTGFNATSVLSTKSLAATPLNTVDISISTPNLTSKNPAIKSQTSTALNMVKNVIATQGILGSQDLEVLLKNITTMEAMMKSAMERAVRAELRAKKVEEELSKMKKSLSSGLTNVPVTLQK